MTPFLFFVVKEVARLKSVLNLPVEEGLGGERHQGKGRFDRWEERSIVLPEEGEYLLLWSLAKPKKEELSSLLMYELVLRDGFIFRGEPVGWRKKAHWKLREGSITKLPFQGENVEVSPREDWSVISYGRAIGWAFRAKEGAP